MGAVGSRPPASEFCSCKWPAGGFPTRAASVEESWLVHKVFLCASPLDQPLLGFLDHDFLAFETVCGSEKRFYAVEKVRAPRREDTVLLHDGPTFHSVYRQYDGGMRRQPNLRAVQAFRPSQPLTKLLAHVERHMLRPYSLLRDDCGTFAQELFDLALLSCGERMPAAGGIAVRPGGEPAPPAEEEPQPAEEEPRPAEEELQLSEAAPLLAELPEEPEEPEEPEAPGPGGVPPGVPVIMLSAGPSVSAGTEASDFVDVASTLPSPAWTEDGSWELPG